MSSIDNRIVQMQFENKQFEKGIKQSIGSIDELKKKLEFKKYAPGIKELEKSVKTFSLENLASNIDSIAKRFSNLGIIGTTALVRISNAAVTTGKNVVRSLTIDPLRMGLREYETQINAIQTILSNTRSKGTTIDDVNAALDELNMYADKTIYNFTEMTRNIGTFTAAGIGLDTSVAAIKGLSNLAAISGSNPTQAATAMYQLSQALAAGTVRLMDWNSIVNAGMGGEVFQDALKETARVHGTNIDQMIEKEGSFRETLQNGWLTAEVMLETLQKFTGDLSKEQIVAMGYTEEQAQAILDLGEDANNAATKVKTFTQLIDTLKEALQSGWTQSWEYIIGNFEEARELWTSVSDAIGGIINESANARNELLKGWYEAGGRTDLIQGLKDIFSGLYGIIVAIKEAMKDIFPTITVENLLAISDGVQKFGERLKYLLRYRDVLTGYKEIEKTKEQMEDTLAFAKNLKEGMRGDEVSKLQTKLKELGYEVGEIDGIFGKKTKAAFDKYKQDFKDGLIGTTTGTEVEKVSEYTTLFGEALMTVRSIAKGAFSIISIGVKIFAALGKAVLKVADALSPLLNVVSTIALAIADFFTKLNERFSESEWITDFSESFSETMSKFKQTITDASNWILDFLGLGEEFEGFDGLFDKISNGWKKVTSAFKKSNVWEKVQRVFASLKETFESIGPAISDFFKSVKENLGEEFTNLFNKFVEKIPEISEKIGNFFIELVKKIKPFIKKVPEYLDKIKTFFGDIWDVTKGFVARVPGFISKIFDFFKGLYEQAKNSEKLQNFADKISSAFDKVITSIKNFFSKIKEAFGSGLEKGKDAAGTVGAELVKVYDVFPKIGDAIFNIAEWFGKSANWINNFINIIGPGGLIGLLIIAMGTVSIYKLVKSITGFVEGITNIGQNLAKASKSQKDTTSLSKKILSIAIAIGILVAAVYFLGNMETGQFVKGAIALGVLVAALVGIAVACGMIGKRINSKAIAQTGGAIFDLAKSIGIIVAAIYILGNIKTGVLVKGTIALTVIIGLLALLMRSMTKTGKNGVTSTKVQLKGFVGLAVAIGVIAIAVASLGKMPLGQSIKGLISVSMIILLLKSIIKSVGKAGGTASMRGFLGLSLAIGVLVGVIKILSMMDVGGFLKGFVGLFLIVTVLKSFMKSLKNLNSGMKITDYVGLMIMGVVAGMLSYLAAIIGGMDTKALIQGILGLYGVMGAMVLMSKASSKSMNIKSVITSMLAMIPLAGVMLLFVTAIKKLDGVDSDKILNFGLAIGAIMTGLGVMTGLAGAVGFGGAIGGILGIVGAITAIIAAFGLLTKIPGFDSFMQGGAESIGNILGTLAGSIAGSFKASQMKMMASGMEALGEFDIDQDKLSNTLGAFNLISEFENSLPDKSIGQKFSDALFGSALQNFAIDMIYFGASAKSLSNSMQGVDIDVSETGPVAKSVKAAEMINGLAQAVGTLTIEESIANKINGESAFATFCGDMVTFGTKIRTAYTYLRLIPEDVIAYTQRSVDAATMINDLASAIKPISITDTIVEKIRGGSPFAKFCEDIKTFADSAKVFGTNITGMADTNIVNDTITAVDCATKISEFISALSGMDIEANKSKIAEWFTGDTKSNTVIDQIAQIGTSIASMATNISGLSEGTFASDITAAKEALDKIVEFLETVAGATIDDAGIVTQGIMQNTDSFLSYFGQIGSRISEFNSNTEDVDSERFASITTSLNDMAAAFAEFMPESFEKIFDGTALSEKITNFATTVGASLQNGTESLSGSISQFNAAGSSLSSAMSSGFGDSADTSGVSSVCEAMLTAASSYNGSFRTAGYNMGLGLANGIRNSSSIAQSAARAVARSMLASAKNALGIHSPSREFGKVGRYIIMGLAKGVSDTESIASTAVTRVSKNTLSTFKAAVENIQDTFGADIGNEPVIRPIVDMSSVNSSARAINSMLSGRTDISMNANLSSQMARDSATASKMNKNNQNGNSNNGNLSNNDNRVVLSGNTFNVRSDNDIYAIASEIAAIKYREQMSYGG